MINLGPLGPLMWQGGIYLPLLCAALVIALLRGAKDRPYVWVALLTALNWAGTRLVDCSELGCGAIGFLLVANVGSEHEAVARIALSMQAVDLITVVLLLYFARPLTFRWLLAALYGCMVPFYLLAFVGWINGAAALTFVNGIGILQLILIMGAAGGGSALLALGRRSSVHFDRYLGAVDRLAAWLDVQENQGGTPEAARRQR